MVASVGSAQALDGREAGLQAAHKALNRLGANVPGFAVVIASHQYQAREVLNGVTSLLGDTPMIGFSSSEKSRSALCAGMICFSAAGRT